MGEHKLPKPQSATPKRPSMSIFNLRGTVEAARGVWATLEEDERGYLTDLKNLIAWVDELEAATDPFAKVVPLLDQTVSDETPILAAVDAPASTLHDLTAGHFRRLNPNAVASAAKTPLNS